MQIILVKLKMKKPKYSMEDKLKSDENRTLTLLYIKSHFSFYFLTTPHTLIKNTIYII